MKKIFVILSMLLILSATKNYAEERSSHGLFSEIETTSLNLIEDKIYLSAEQVVISNDGIYVLLNDVGGNTTLYPISNLESDAIGLFVSIYNLRGGNPYNLNCSACLERICTECGCCTNQRCYRRTCRCGRW